MWGLKTFDWKQPVNQWLCIALIGVMCFWVALFYFVNQTGEVAASYQYPDFTRDTH